jgi:hypothetical protein
MRLVLCVPALSMMRCTSGAARDLRLDGVLILLLSSFPSNHAALVFALSVPL